MTIDELLSQLRDIQTPPVPAGAHGIELSWTPFAIFALLVVLVGLLSIWRSQHWRRDIQVRLNGVRQLPELPGKWQALVRLAMDVALHTGKSETLPNCVYIPGTRARAKDFAQVESYLHRATRPGFRR